LRELKIGKREIGRGHPAFIVAELSGNHLQDFDLAVRTIKAMKEAGADAVKLQTYTPDTITIDSNAKPFLLKGGTIWDGRTLYDLYREAYTPWEWQPKLKELAYELGLEFFSTPFDRTAVDFLETMNVPVYKVASPEITDIPLIEYIALKEKPVIISTGVAMLCDIQEAINACRRVGNSQIILLKCTSAYPTPIEDVNLRTIPNLRETFRVVVGLSDHTLGISVPIASIALGAKIIEKHFVLDKKLGGPDATFSLEPNEFGEMVKAVREAEKALGEVTYELTESMKNSRQYARSLFITEDMIEGDIFTEKNVRSIRPGQGLEPKHIFHILGKRITRNAKRGTPLNWNMITQDEEMYEES
jgi:pseudaminic acid synthase